MTTDAAHRISLSCAFAGRYQPPQYLRGSAQYAAGGGFVRQRDKLALRADLVSCDYYDWFRGILEAIYACNGEYMAQYSWGEWSMDSRHFTEEEADV